MHNSGDTCAPIVSRAARFAEGQLLLLRISEEGDRFTKVINDYWYAPR
jgi:hypothetical protein